MTTTPDDQRLRDLARLRRVRDRIDREYAQPLDVTALAAGVHVSAGHLSREFKAAAAAPGTAHGAAPGTASGAASAAEAGAVPGAERLDGLPACVARRVTRPVRNREARAGRRS